LFTNYCGPASHRRQPGHFMLGHVWSALRAHDFARAHGGRFVLRLEDIDQTRCRADYVDSILADLDWLGLHPDAMLVQSQHGDRYRAALETLIAAGLAYRCWCTRREIATAGGAPQGEAGPVYPRICRHRADPGDGRPFCWRLDSHAAAARFGRLVWHDALAGPVIADPHALGDVVIARKDAETSYSSCGQPRRCRARRDACLPLGSTCLPRRMSTDSCRPRSICRCRIIIITRWCAAPMASGSPSAATRRRSRRCARMGSMHKRWLLICAPTAFRLAFALMPS